MHTDQPFTWALNFVFEGHGELQWVDIDADYIFTKHAVMSGEIFRYKKYTTIRNISTKESWSGTSALIRVDLPHRIVTNNNHRISLSLVSRYTFQTFDTMCQIINHY